MLGERDDQGDELGLLGTDAEGEGLVEVGVERVLLGARLLLGEAPGVELEREFDVNLAVGHAGATDFLRLDHHHLYSGMDWVKGSSMETSLPADFLAKFATSFLKNQIKADFKAFGWKKVHVTG